MAGIVAFIRYGTTQLSESDERILAQRIPGYSNPGNRIVIDLPPQEFTKDGAAKIVAAYVGIFKQWTEVGLPAAPGGPIIPIDDVTHLIVLFDETLPKGWHQREEFMLAFSSFFGALRASPRGKIATLLPEGVEMTFLNSGWLVSAAK